MPPKETKREPSEYSYVTDEEEEHAPAPASAAPPRTPPRVVGTAAKSRVHVPNSPPSESSSERAPRARGRAAADVAYPPSADVPPAPERPKTERVEGPGRAGRTSRADAVAVAGGRTAASAVAAAPRTAEAPAEPDDAAPPREAREPRAAARSGRRRRETIECPICWGSVVKGPAGLSQHQFWSEICNTWRLHTQNGLTWPQAERQAKRLKQDREQQEQEEITPARNLTMRQKLEGREAKAAVTMEDVLELLRAQKKSKKHKRRRRRHESPTPEVERTKSRRGDRDPPSDDPERGPSASVRKGPGGSLILQIPAHMVQAS